MSDKKRYPYLPVYTVLCAIVIVIIGWIYWTGWSTTVLVVRHAERGNTPNANLTADGIARAEELATVASEAGVTAIYVTEFCRTAQTAKPLAEALGLTMQVQRFAGAGLTDCDPAVPADLYELLPPGVDTTEEVADRILSSHRGEAVLVVGHSDTVPDWVAHLGDGSFDTVTIGNAYDRLFVVSAYSLADPRLIKARYGPFSCPGGAQATCAP